MPWRTGNVFCFLGCFGAKTLHFLFFWEAIHTQACETVPTEWINFWRNTHFLWVACVNISSGNRALTYHSGNASHSQHSLLASGVSWWGGMSGLRQVWHSRVIKCAHPPALSHGPLIKSLHVPPGSQGSPTLSSHMCPLQQLHFHWAYDLHLFLPLKLIYNLEKEPWPKANGKPKALFSLATRPTVHLTFLVSLLYLLTFNKKEYF